MTRNDFKKVPHRSKSHFQGAAIQFNTLVIIPRPQLHESGYRMMEFCLVDHHDEPICLIGGGTDVVNIDGIGGHGLYEGSVPFDKKVDPKGWTFDVLPCGYLQLWVRDYDLFVRDDPLSTLEIFAVPREKENVKGD